MKQTERAEELDLVTTVNHGDVFGGGSPWYTFNCPKCTAQVEAGTNKCKVCGKEYRFKQAVPEKGE